MRIKNKRSKENFKSPNIFDKMVEKKEKMIKSTIIFNIAFFCFFCFHPVQSQPSKEPEVKEYRKYLIELVGEKDYVRQFLMSHPFDTIVLFLSKNRFSIENIQKISELENPYQYFDFLFRLSTEDKRFEKFSFYEFMKGYYQKVLDDPWTFYDAYEKLFQKADGAYAEIFADYFQKILLVHFEFILYKLSQDPEWKKRALRMHYLCKEIWEQLRERVPNTAFGNEFKKFIEEEYK